LRQDNADLRLTEKGYKVGLVTEERYQRTMKKKEMIEKELERLKKVVVTPTKEVNDILNRLGSAPIKISHSLYDLIKRPELTYESIKELDSERQPLPREIKMQVEIQIKYEGYIKKQMQQIEQFKKLEGKKLPEDLDYSQIRGLSNEAVQKLNKIKPDSVGQASRISGVSPADINVLLIYLEQKRREKKENKND